MSEWGTTVYMCLLNVRSIHQSITGGLIGPSIWHLYLVHVELAYMYVRIWITSDRNEVWAQELYLSTALVEAAKSLVLSNVIGHGKVPYQKPWLKSMGACQRRLRTITNNTRVRHRNCTTPTQPTSTRWVSISPHKRCINLYARWLMRMLSVAGYAWNFDCAQLLWAHAVNLRHAAYWEN